MIRVVIADDHAVVREGLKRIIDDAGGMLVTAEAAHGQELLCVLAKQRCDVVLMDLSMPGMPGLEVLQEIRRARPRLPVLVLTMFPEDQYAVRVLATGAAGYINKGDPPEELLDAIRTAAAGRRYISAQAAQCLAEHLVERSSRPPHETLSNREYEVMRLIAAGKRTSDIAQELCLSIKTISTFRRRILDKLGLRRNADITRYAIGHGLIE